MARKDIRYVTQDGADFYLFLDEDMTRLLRTVTAPMRVRDWDMASATKAREWFTRLMADAAYEIRWPNPFGKETASCE